MENKVDPVLTDINKIGKGHRSFLVYHYLVKDLRYAIEKYASGNVIDVGCGNKPYESFFQSKITQYVGCDNHQGELNKVDIICDVTALPFPGASFDTALCTQVIEHVPDHNLLVKEIHRVLKPGGQLILSAPLYWPEHGEPNDFFRFTRFGLEHILQEQGFTVTETIANGGSWATAGQSLVHAVDLSRRHSFYFRVVRFLFFRMGFIRLTNSLFRWMDKKDFNVTNTINYVIVAQKKS